MLAQYYSWIRCNKTCWNVVTKHHQFIIKAIWHPKWVFKCLCVFLYHPPMVIVCTFWAVATKLLNGGSVLNKFKCFMPFIRPTPMTHTKTDRISYIMGLFILNKNKKLHVDWKKESRKSIYFENEIITTHFYISVMILLYNRM